jgi:hypothetical protein
VGEIGRDRREFLYDLTFCEIILISRGYHRRQHPSWEQTRWIAYQVRYCLGVPKGEIAKPPHQWMPFSWEKEPRHRVSREEIDDMQALIANVNAELNEKKEASEQR